MLDVIARTADETFTPLTVGGGVRTEADVEALLEAGADKVSLNSAAVTDPELVRRCADRWGSQAIVVAIDVEGRPPSLGEASAPNWEVVTHGGRTRTGLSAREWAERVALLGAGEILLTSMDRDGTLSGYDLELLRMIAETVRRARHRVGRSGHARASARRHPPGPRQRGSRRIDLPRRHLPIGEAKAFLAKRRHPDAPA